MSFEEAARIADMVFGHAVSLDPVGMTETELAHKIDERMSELGAEGNAFDTIVAVGENSAEIHHEPESVEIVRGEPVVIDLGAVHENVCSDMTRTVVFGKPSDKFLTIKDIVREAQEQAISCLEAGVTGGELDEVARSMIDEAGYGDEFDHSLGHGVGEEVHESPKIGPDSEDVVSEGDVVTIEPGIYIDGEFGVRIEDLFRVTDEGAEKLSEARLRTDD